MDPVIAKYCDESEIYKLLSEMKYRKGYTFINTTLNRWGGEEDYRNFMYVKELSSNETLPVMFKGKHMEFKHFVNLITENFNINWIHGADEDKRKVEDFIKANGWKYVNSFSVFDNYTKKVNGEEISIEVGTLQVGITIKGCAYIDINSSTVYTLLGQMLHHKLLGDDYILPNFDS